MSLIPAILVFVSRMNKDVKERKKSFIWLDLLSILVQLLCVIGWPLIIHYENMSKEKARESDKSIQFWAIPFALIFISLGYWDNYLIIKPNKKKNVFIKFLVKVKQDLDKSRYFTYAVMSIWKIVMVVSAILIYYGINDLVDHTQCRT